MVVTNGFLEWFSTWGSVIYATMQMLFWVFVAFAAVYAALAYKRLVDSKIAQHDAKSAMLAAKPESKIAIDEFIE